MIRKSLHHYKRFHSPTACSSNHAFRFYNTTTTTNEISLIQDDKSEKKGGITNLSPHSTSTSVLKSHKHHFFSKQFIPITRKDTTSSEDGVASYRYLVSSGFIKQVSSGFFHYLPLSVRVLEKIIDIIDDELSEIGCSKLSMPIVTEANLWSQSGRLQKGGPELVTFKFGSKYFVLSPTHEESITSLIANTRYQSGSIRTYQIGTKFRNELRPRFGLIRAKEFIMKDLYTFDKDKESALETYHQVRNAYIRIFDRIGLKYKIVDADSGSIGGSNSEEFQALTDIGEDTLISCKCGKYACNLEKAVGSCNVQIVPKLKQMKVPREYIENFYPSNNSQEIQLLECTIVPKSKNLKQKESKRTVHVIIHSSRKINPILVKQLLDAEDVLVSDEKSIDEKSIDELIIDESLADIWCKIEHDQMPQTENNENGNDVSNYDDKITANQVLLRFGNIKEVMHGDQCVQSDTIPECTHDTLDISRGIEIGHIFYLGTKYSNSFQAKHPSTRDYYEMGCYGIGVSRLIQIVVESYMNEKGDVHWPASVAPFKLCIIPLHFTKNKQQLDILRHKAIELSAHIQEQLPQHFYNDIIIDDRMMSHVVKSLKDASLIGFPYILVLGEKYLTEGIIELQSSHEQVTRYFDQSSMVQFLSQSFNPPQKT